MTLPEQRAAMSVRTRVAGRILAWTTGFAVVIALAIMGGQILAIMSEQWSYPSRLAQHGQDIDGVVVDEGHSGGGLGTTPQEEIKISFTVPGGKRYDFWSSGHANIGDRVTVRYDPDNPDNASINSAAHRMVGIVVGIVAGLVLLIGLPFLFLKHAWAAFRRPGGEAA
ncbi:DUF3592 domain-containing protein [Actinomadura sp. KC06]|uniref:DUF3592 domain-containing protein n=1 Tax=Actinomadura sp. KC06 TaxID=2530369 RepID=UPI001FB851B6|nr:DUF3592 domain-containing protein [Actinomadura sp. KC06]